LLYQDGTISGNFSANHDFAETESLENRIGFRLGIGSIEDDINAGQERCDILTGSLTDIGDPFSPPGSDFQGG
jgi:hypothetical protein